MSLSLHKTRRKDYAPPSPQYIKRGSVFSTSASTCAHYLETLLESGDFTDGRASWTHGLRIMGRVTSEAALGNRDRQRQSSSESDPPKGLAKSVPSFFRCASDAFRARKTEPASMKLEALGILPSCMKRIVSTSHS